MRVALLLIGLAVPAIASAQTPDPGRVAFETRCARCHGADGAGGEMGPSIVQRLTTRDDAQLASLVRDGLPTRGMPANAVAEPELAALVKFLRTIERRPSNGSAPRTFQLTSGKTLAGRVTGEGFDDLQVRTADDR